MSATGAPETETRREHTEDRETAASSRARTERRSPEAGTGSLFWTRPLDGLRGWIPGLFLALLAFIQTPGALISDTKFDLVVNPGRFLQRALTMWDGDAAFGQIQNQAYGYFFPMGPFFWLGNLLNMPMWVVQRLWWTLLLCMAFYGVIKVAQQLRIGGAWGQIAGAFAYTLGVHVTTILGASSVEAWPTAMAPWVLWCLIRGSESGSVRRWAACAALFTTLAGGVNAVAVSVVLPMGVIWLLTRKGPRRWALLGWWAGCTFLGTLWWLVPLLLMGAYSFPFLDYIENATITTLPTDMVDVLGGSNNWVAYIDARTNGAGNLLASNGFLILDAAVLAGAGLYGIVRSDNQHRRFLLTCLWVGVVLVGFGYYGPGHGWWATERAALLDGPLAPIRNVHKYDAVLRLPLALGTAHVLTVWGRQLSGDKLGTGGRLFAVLVCLVGLTTPWITTVVAPQMPVSKVPDYWQQTADYLDETQTGSRALVVPGSPFASYTWGEPRDDILQPLLYSPWGVRNVVPLAQPGNVVLLDSITEAMESGRPSPELAPLLAANGIDRLVVRNDLDRVRSGVPDPVVVHQSLDNSPGLKRVETFGPMQGSAPIVELGQGTKVAPSGGLAGRYPAVEVYEVTDPAPRVFTRDAADVPVTTGRPGGEILGTGMHLPALFTGDERAAGTGEQALLTDSLRRREKSFALTRSNESATMAADDPWQLRGGSHFHQMTPNQDELFSTVAWRGIEGVSASSSQSWVDAAPPLTRSQSPGAALDGDETTTFTSNVLEDPVGQWWQVDLPRNTVLTNVRVQIPRFSGVDRIELSNGKKSREYTFEDGENEATIATDFGFSDRLRITALGTRPGWETNPFSLSDVTISGVRAERYVQLPAAGRGVEKVAQVSLTRDQGASGCFDLQKTVLCRDSMATQGDDGNQLLRRFSLPQSGEYEVDVRGSLLPAKQTYREIARALPFQITSTDASTDDVRGSALAMVDGNPRTSWISASDVENPEITLRWDRPTTIDALDLELNEAVPASEALYASLRADGARREVRLRNGSGKFKPLTTRELTITLVGRSSAYDSEIGDNNRLANGITELSVTGDGENLIDGSTTRLDSQCGQGPGILVNGKEIQTKLDGTVADAIAGRATVGLCGDGRVRLERDNTVEARSTGAIRVDHLGFTAASGAPSWARSGNEKQQQLTGLKTPRWEAEDREVEVPAADDKRLMVVSENFNDGWKATLDGRTLDPQRVDGWRQGWWIPAGAQGTVTLEFTPGTPYRIGLIVGLLGVLALLAVALVRPRKASALPPTQPAWSEAAFWVAALVGGGLLAGWWGFGAAVLGAAAHYLWKRDRSGFAIVAGLAVLVAGAYTGWMREDGGGLAREAWTQILLVAALVAAGVAMGRETPADRVRAADGSDPDDGPDPNDPDDPDADQGPGPTGPAHSTGPVGPVGTAVGPATASGPAQVRTQEPTQGSTPPRAPASAAEPAPAPEPAPQPEPGPESDAVPPQQLAPRGRAFLYRPGSGRSVSPAAEPQPVPAPQPESAAPEPESAAPEPDNASPEPDTAGSDPVQQPVVPGNRRAEKSPRGPLSAVRRRIARRRGTDRD